MVGNGGGGKSTLSAALSRHYAVPWYEIDKIQFGPGWSSAPVDQVRFEIEAIVAGEEWLIDGFGPYDTMVSRFQAADLIVFVDFPLWIHYWWAMERQIAAHLGEERLGGPEGCDLRDVNKRMCQAIWHVHTEIRPRLVEDLAKWHGKVRTITSPEEMDAYLLEPGSPHE